MIQPPAYKKNAVPSPRGWRHPRTGELLKKVKLTEEEINEYLISQGTISAPESEVVETIENEEIETAEDINDEIEELLSDEIDLDSMTKNELIALAEEWGVDIDPKATKATIKAQLDEEVD